MKDTNITFKLSEAEKAMIKKVSAERDIPMSQLIRKAIRNYLEESEV